MGRSFAFVFICQHGELEIKACLLAASLKKYLRCDYELIAAIPTPASQWRTPSTATKSFLSALHVRFVETGNAIDSTYPIANKVDCLRVSTNTDKLVFLDSDMLLMRDFSDQPRFGIAFNARPASYPTFSTKDSDWEPVYKACGAPLPTARIRTTYSRDYILPYFNAAFVAVPAKSNFGDAWLDCCRKIDALDVPNKRPYLDQISLGVAAAKLGMPLDCLNERYNHPINFKPLSERDLPYFCHYHDVPTLLREPAAVALVQQLMEDDPDLTNIIQSSPNWNAMIKRRVLRRPRRITPELIITGIPRSGTSYLCNLLHRHDNCVVINEPAEAPRALMEDNEPFGIPRLFRDLRRDIIEAKPVRNKLDHGQVTEDTSLSNAVESYIPQIATDDFVLGIKATLAFLSRLPALAQVMPNARFVACIRDPLDCIASWKSSFAHLRDADVDGINIGNSNDPWLSGIQRKQLKTIAAIPDASSRRAAWWSYMASLILDSREDLVLVRYNDLVLHPARTIERIAEDWPIGMPREALKASSIRTKRDNLDANDIAAVNAICCDAARALGLWK